MQLVRQSTAATILMGQFVDNGDGVTPETGLAAGTVDEIGVYKNDATSLTDISGTTTFTHRSGGWYTMTLSTSDTDTLGRMTALVRDDSVCLPVWKDLMVLPANVYDALVLGTDKLYVDMVELSSDATAADDLELLVENAKGTDHKMLVSTDAQDLSGSLDVNTKTLANDVITAAKIATDAITSDELATSALNEIADAILCRDWTSVAGEAARSVLNALRFLRNKWTVAVGTLVVYEEDDSTIAWQGAVTTDATADPVSEVDPA